MSSSAYRAPRCASCGSQLVRRQAMCLWDELVERWEVDSLGPCVCDACGHTGDPVMVDAEDAE